MRGMTGDARENIGQPCLRIDAVHLAGDDEAIHGRGAPTSAIGPAEQPRFSAKGYASQATFRGIVREANAAIFKEQREGRPALENVVDRLDEIVPAREPSELRAH